MKAELDIKMELEGSKQQLDIQEGKHRKLQRQYGAGYKCVELRVYINKLKGRIWALEFVLNINQNETN